MLVGGFPGTEQNDETKGDVTDNYQLGVNYDIGSKFVNPCK